MTSPQAFHPGYAAAAEIIASRDKNNLFLTSRLFADAERYRSFCAQYAVMRLIDDRIDGMPLIGGMPERAAARQSADMLRAWRGIYRLLRLDRDHPAIARLDLGTETAVLAASLGQALATFPVPDILWRRFFQAMRRDIQTRGFRTYRDFLTYCKGASEAPTTIYLYLLASRPDRQGVYVVPGQFPLFAAGALLGRFAYVAHILRDLAEDTKEDLVYIAEEDLTRHGLTFPALRADVAAGRSSLPLLALVRDLSQRARTALSRAGLVLAPHWSLLAPDCRTILALIMRVYECTLDRIEACDFEVLNGRHMLTSRDKQLLFLEAMGETEACA